MTPKVTIGLPIYNGSALCRRAIDSVLSQTFSDFELLISDNCSTDETEAICRDYARRDARVVYTRTEENVGAAENYSRLARMARGEYFKWISHDDWVTKDFLSECLQIAEQDRQVITVAPITEVRDYDGVLQQSVTTYIGREGWSDEPLERYRQMMDELAYCETHNDGLFMVAYAYAFHRTSLLQRTRLLMPFISSDFVIAAELALFGRLRYLPKPLCVFTLGRSSLGTSANFSQWNPVAIQRMLRPSKTSAWDVQLSVRRRHYEHVAAVLRSPLSAADKLRAVEIAMRPMRARIGARFRKTLARGKDAVGLDIGGAS